MHYLKKNSKALYTTLLMKNELTDYLVSVSNECENRLNNLMEQFKKSDKLLSEKSKEINQLEWVVNVKIELDKNVNLEIGQFVPILFH